MKSKSEMRRMSIVDPQALSMECHRLLAENNKLKAELEATKSYNTILVKMSKDLEKTNSKLINIINKERGKNER